MEQSNEVIAETVTPQEEITPQVEVQPDKDYKPMFEDQRRRAEKAEAEARELREKLESNIEVPSTYEDESLSPIKQELYEIKQKLAKQEVVEAHPELKEMWSDFESFRDNPDNKGMNIKTAAKSFLVEKGILDPQRKGLEKQTGGTRTPIKSGMTAEEVSSLRTTNFKKYREMIKRGDIKL